MGCLAECSDPLISRELSKEAASFPRPVPCSLGGLWESALLRRDSENGTMNANFFEILGVENGALGAGAEGEVQAIYLRCRGCGHQFRATNSGTDGFEVSTLGIRATCPGCHEERFAVASYSVGA